MLHDNLEGFYCATSCIILLLVIPHLKCDSDGMTPALWLCFQEINSEKHWKALTVLTAQHRSIGRELDTHQRRRHNPKAARESTADDEWGKLRVSERGERTGRSREHSRRRGASCEWVNEVREGVTELGREHARRQRIGCFARDQLSYLY